MTLSEGSLAEGIWPVISWACNNKNKQETGLCTIVLYSELHDQKLFHTEEGKGGKRSQGNLPSWYGTSYWWVEVTVAICRPVNRMYCQTSNISRTLVGNKIVDHSDVVGASSVGAAPTTSSFSTWHLVSIDRANTTVRWDEKHLSFWIWCDLH